MRLLQAGRTLRYKWRFDIPGGDPCYQETAKMAIEAALCLVLGEGEPSSAPGRCGQARQI